MSATTPTTVRAPSDSDSLMPTVSPSGSRPLRNRRTNSSLTTATDAPGCSSDSRKVRPERSGMRRVRK